MSPLSSLELVMTLFLADQPLATYGTFCPQVTLTHHQSVSHAFGIRLNFIFIALNLENIVLSSDYDYD